MKWHSRLQKYPGTSQNDSSNNRAVLQHAFLYSSEHDYNCTGERRELHTCFNFIHLLLNLIAVSSSVLIHTSHLVLTSSCNHLLGINEL